MIGTTRAAAIAALLACSASLTACAASGGVPGATSSRAADTSNPASPTTSATPSPVASTASEGFDREAVYAACNAAVPVDVWGPDAPLPAGPIVADSFGAALSNAYTASDTHGDPNAMYVNVQYFRGDTFAFSALCVASGDPTSPRVEFIRTLD
jgi:hypothetical protein